MAESSGESLNILDDYSEFLNEYEETTRGCFNNSKKVLANIINKSNLIDFDKYIGTHLKKLQSSIEYLTLKIADCENSVEEQNQIMGQSMQNKFDKDTVSAYHPQFSSSVGFKDIPSKHRNHSQIRMKKQSPEQRTTAYSRWTKGSDNALKNLSAVEDFYKTNNALNNCHNTIKILLMNCEELQRKFENTHNEYEIMQDLITENEEHFIDLVENTERFIQDIQDTGFQPQEFAPSSNADMQNYKNSNARKYIKELDSIVGEYYTESPTKKAFVFGSPYDPFTSARSCDRENNLRKNQIRSKESNLIERINELQKQIQIKETDTAIKYESTIENLEKKLKAEAQQHNDIRCKYKTLALSSLNFQCALKDLQKAVRAKKSNISSFKKIFDERSKQLSNELLKYKGKVIEQKAEYTYRKEMYDSLKSKTASPSPAGSEKKNRVKSELKMAPANLNKIYNEKESKRNKAEVERLNSELQKLEKLLESNKVKKKEVSRERDILQELCIAKESIISEKDNIILGLQKSKTLKKEGNQEESIDEGDYGALQIYKVRLQKADAEIDFLKKEIIKIKEKDKDISIMTADAGNYNYLDQIQKEKAEAEELIDDTQKLIDGKIRTISARLAEKEKQLERIENNLRSKIDSINSNLLPQARLELEQKMNSLKNTHKDEVEQLKAEIENSKKYQEELNQLKLTQRQDKELLKSESEKLAKCKSEMEALKLKLKHIEDFQEEVKLKNQEIKAKNDELVRLHKELEFKEHEITGLNDQLLLEKSRKNKEIKDMKQELLNALKEVELKNEIIQEKDELKSQIDSLLKRQADYQKQVKLEDDQKDRLIQEKEEANFKLKNDINLLKQEIDLNLSAKDNDYENKLKELRNETKLAKQELHNLHEAEIKEHEERIKEMRSKMNKLSEDKTNNESRLLDQISELKQGNAKVLLENDSKYKEEISKLKVQLLHKGNECTELSKSIELEKTLASTNLQKVENSLKKLLDKANTEVEELRIKCEQAENQILLLTRQHSKTVKELKIQIEETDDKINELQDQISKLNKEKHEIQVEKQDLMASLNNANKDITEKVGSIELINKNIFKENQSLLQDKENLENQIENLKKTNEKLILSSTSTAKENQELNERLEEAERLKVSADDDLKTLKKKLNEEIFNLKLNLTGKEKEIEKLTEKLHTKDKDITSKNYEIEYLNGELKELQDKNELLKQDLESKKSKIRENEAIIIKLKDEVDQFEYSSQTQQEVVITEVAEPKSQLVSNAFDQSKTEIIKLKLELEELQDQINNKNNELLKSQSDLKNLKSELKSFQNELLDKNECINESQVTLNKMIAEVEKLRKEKEFLVQESTNNIKALQTEIQKKDSTVGKLSNEIESLKNSSSNEIKSLKDKIDINEKELKQAQVKIMSSTQTSEKFSSDLEKRMNILEDKNKSLQSQISQLKATLSEKEKNITNKLEIITNLQSENSKLKNEIEEYEESTNSLSDALTKAKVENGELNYKIKRLEESKSQQHFDSMNEQETNNMRFINMNTRVNDLEEENRKLRKTINDLNENESKLLTEIGQYKLNFERIKREKADEKERQQNEKDELIEEANKFIEDFNAEKHLIKAKIKRLLIEYCDLDEDSYHIDDDVDMDEYLEILEKELKVFTDRIKEESMDKISKIMVDLESAQNQQTSLGVELERLQKENADLYELKEEIEGQLNSLKKANEQLKKKNLELEKFSQSNTNNEDELIQLNEEIDDLKTTVANYEDKIEEMQNLVTKYQEEKINISEKLQFTERELANEKEKNSKLKVIGNLHQSKVVDISRETEDVKEYLDRIEIVEKRVDSIKNEIGQVMNENMQSLDDIKKTFEEKHREYIKRVHEKLIESNIKEKGLINVLEELKGNMNDSIRVLKCITHEDVVWFLIEEDIEFEMDNEIPQQYWIKEADLSADEKEYLHKYLPTSMKEEDIISNEPINRVLRMQNKKYKQLRDERKELLTELREIRFGLRVSYFLMDGEFDEETEQKIHEYELKFIEYEDDITYLTENLQDQKMKTNELEIQITKCKRRIEELNGIISNISKGANDTVENFLKSYQKTNNLIHQNKMLQEEIDSKNDEIESLKSYSACGRHNELSSLKKEDSKSEGMSHPEFDVNEFDIKDMVNSKGFELMQENEILRQKMKTLEEDMMDIQNRNNIILEQNKKLKNEVNELEARMSSRSSLSFEGETTKEKTKDIDHVKDILLKFVCETPITDKGNEQLLLIIFSMLYLTKPQIDEVQKARKLATAEYEADILKRNKKGMFGGLFSKKDKKNKQK